MGSLIAQAYPERIARAVDNIGNFRMANGNTVFIDKSIASNEALAEQEAERLHRVINVALVGPENDWQRTLLESARRGEHIVRFDGERTAIAQARSVV